MKSGLTAVGRSQRVGEADARCIGKHLGAGAAAKARGRTSAGRSSLPLDDGGRNEPCLGQEATCRSFSPVKRQRPLRSGKRDVREPALSFDALTGRPLLLGDLERATVRELAFVTSEHVHLRPFAAFGAMDRRQLDAIAVVADRCERIAAGLQQGPVLRNGLAGRLASGLVEYLELDSLRCPECPLVVAEVLVEAAGAA